MIDTTSTPEITHYRRANITWADLTTLLTGKSVLLSNGHGVDADSLGSMLATAELISPITNSVVCSVPESVPEDLRFLPGITRVTTVPSCREFDVVIGFECGDWKRFPFAEEFDTGNAGSCQMVNLDHHPQPNPFGDYFIVDTSASSTCQMIYEWGKESHFSFSPPVAQNLLAGLMADTGSFVHANTTASVFRMAADLLGYGARTHMIATRLFRHKSLPVAHLWGRALSRAHVSPEHGAIVSVITEHDLLELGLRPSQNEGIVETLNTAKEGGFTLLLTQDHHRVKGSLRSEPKKGVDVSRIARLFGGGGHPLASGFSVTGRLVEKNGAWSIVTSRTHEDSSVA